MDSESIITSLLMLRPGESVVYFSGFLDMSHRGSFYSTKAATLALKLALDGKVLLTQRRLGLPTKDGIVDWRAGIGPGFEYIATGTLERKNEAK